MFRVVIALGLAFLIAGSAVALVSDETPKYTVKEVMKKAHNGRNSLFNRVKSGQASDEEKAQLVDYYESLPLGMPKKGSPAGYKKMAEDLLAAATAVKNGEPNGIAKLSKAGNCMACHNIYK
jgi:cytochrome c553